VSNFLSRRKFLTRAWQTGGALMGAVAAWTTWDVLQPLPTTGFGGLVRALKREAISGETVIEVPAARAYLTTVDDEVVALSVKCTHLGCRVPFCESSGMFECPCHGSVFNRAGDYLTGPSPRGMDRYPVEEGEDGFLYINTAETEEGPAPGVQTIDSTPKGPSCAAEGGH
jgi:cytochrome b6-f complex iron-sulfur subunit